MAVHLLQGELMLTKNTPTISLSLLAVSGGLMLLPESWQSVFYFDRAAVGTGSVYKLISGHFIHSDINHWFWNGVALLILGAVIELRSKRLLLTTLLAGIVTVDVLLLSTLSSLDYYCGLSGVLNTLLAIVLWIVWQEYRSNWVIISALLCSGKIVLEIFLNHSLIIHIQWPPYPEAHLAGALAGGALLLAQQAYRKIESY